MRKFERRTKISNYKSQTNKKPNTKKKKKQSQIAKIKNITKQQQVQMRRQGSKAMEENKNLACFLFHWCTDEHKLQNKRAEQNEVCLEKIFDRLAAIGGLHWAKAAAAAIHLSLGRVINQGFVSSCLLNGKLNQH